MREIKATHTTDGSVVLIDAVIRADNNYVYILYVKEDGTLAADTIDKFTVMERLPH